jgi:L-lactate dehydrogenase complex protein LldF
MKWVGRVFQRPWLYSLLGGAARSALRWLPRSLIYHRLNPWGKQRELPPPPAKSFRQLYRERKP